MGRKESKQTNKTDVYFSLHTVYVFHHKLSITQLLYKIIS